MERLEMKERDEKREGVESGRGKEVEERSRKVCL